MKKILLFFCLMSSGLFSQSLDNSRLFLNSIIDAPKSTLNYVEMKVLTKSFNNYNKEYLGVEGNYFVNNNLLINAVVKMPNIASADFTPSFMTIAGRYSLDKGIVNLSIGALLDMQRDYKSSIGYSTAYSIFTATRYSISSKIILINSLRLKFSNEFAKYDGILSSGGIYSLLNKVNIITEMNYSIEQDVFQFGGGLEYKLINQIRIRGGVFQNIEGSDYSMQIGLTYNFVKM